MDGAVRRGTLGSSSNLEAQPSARGIFGPHGHEGSKVLARDLTWMSAARLQSTWRASKTRDGLQ